MKNIFEKYGLLQGRLICASKSTYKNRFPNNKVIFNANIIISTGKIWYGDLDLTVSDEVLKKIASDMNETLYILSEMDARFGTENDDIVDLVKRSLYIVDKNGIRKND